MTSRNQGRGAADSPDLIDILALEEITSTSEDKPTPRETNDHRLAQAINYLDEEGGHDSPATFMDQVDRIDNSLLLPLSQQGLNFDIDLFNRVRNMVRQTQLDFDEAAQGSLSEENSSSTLNRESSIPESAEELPGCCTPSAAEALYRNGEGPDAPRFKPHKSIPATKNPAAEKEEGIHSEHMLEYGGPNDKVERWYKNYPTSIPFPETFQLARWESLKIDYDLSESVKPMKAEGKVVETNVPFDHPTLEQYKSLSPYVSGSRFKLPKPSAAVQKEINRLGTPRRLAEVVETPKRTNNGVKDGKFQYTPRAFLETLTAGDQVDPTTIRHAVNTTPTKSRTGTISSSVLRDVSNTTQKNPLVKPPTKPISNPPPSATSQAYENDSVLMNEPLDLADENTYPAARATHVVYNNLYKAKEHARSSKKHANLVPPASSARTTSPLVRKINRERATSLERSPRRQSGISTAPPSPDTPTKETAVQPQVVIGEFPGSRPPKSPAPVLFKSQPVPAPISVITPRSTAKKPTKRKRNISEQKYTHDPKRSKPMTPPTSKVTKTRAVTKKVTKKAAATGKAVGKAQTKVVVEEIIHEEEHALQITEKQKTKPGVKSGMTRSGLRYLKE
ncbi:uncharacterized protein ALTATR162_LOCUS8519 [Alternaria atra]|uniref:Uncharacterized protein n=1 Tax=Alternaria atra TaxID=119953 RepID=A0A8J2IAH7_9PLEO|nr:uncharacterized protein ALTATR162_LOCUS8519 [Alternaria atra]CAG5178069.1 unnamed protein product [Alternaria atra]